jgi:hypothetical protein
MLTLFSFLSRYDHTYHLYYDTAHGSYGDLSFSQSLVHVQRGVDFLIKKNVDYVIVPPVYELSLLADKKNKYFDKILPLFSRYLTQECFAHSLVGKIGLIGDHTDIEVGQDLFTAFVK